MTQPLTPSTYERWPTGTPQAYLLWNNGQSWLFFDNVLSEHWDEGAQVTEHPVENGPNVADNVRVSVATCNLQIHATNEPIDANNWANPNNQLLPLSLPSPSWVPDSGIRTAKEWNSMQTERVLAGTVGGVAGNIVGGTVGGIIGEVAGSVAGSLLFAPHEEDVTLITDAGNPPPAAPPLLTPTTLQFTQVDDFVARTIAQLQVLKDGATLIQVVGSKDTQQNMVIETFEHDRDKDSGSGALITLGLKQIRIVTTTTVAAPAPTVPHAKPPVSKGTQNTTDAPPQKQSVWFAQQQAVAGH